jgi:AraC-like DNA-binding protein
LNAARTALERRYLMRGHSIPAIKLNEEEKEKLEELIEHYNLKRTSLIRKFIMDGRVKPPLIGKEAGVELLVNLRKIEAELSRLSNNMQKISKIIHRTLKKSY